MIDHKKIMRHIVNELKIFTFVFILLASVKLQSIDVYADVRKDLTEHNGGYQPSSGSGHIDAVLDADLTNAAQIKVTINVTNPGNIDNIYDAWATINDGYNNVLAQGAYLDEVHRPLGVPIEWTIDVPASARKTVDIVGHAGTTNSHSQITVSYVVTQTAHSHKADTTAWQYNSTHHWRKCIGGGNCSEQLNKAAHSYTTFVKTVTAATCTTNRVDQYKCLCGLTTNKTIANTAKGHSYTLMSVI